MKLILFFTLGLLLLHGVHGGWTKFTPGFTLNTCATSFNQSLYILGGKTPHSARSYGTVLNSTLQLSTMPPLLENRGWNGCGHDADGNIYIVGGAFTESATGFAGFESGTTKVQVFNGTHWSWGPSMASPRWYHDVSTLGGNLYATGGFDNLLNTLASVEMLDPAVGEWAAVAPMANGPRARHGSAVLGNLLYVMGGCTDYGCTAGHIVGSVEVFYPGAKAWTKLDDSALPAPRSYFGTAVLGSSILVIGGCTDFSCRAEPGAVWRFQQTGTPHAFSGSWSNAAPFPAQHVFGQGGFGPAAATVTDDAGVGTVYFVAWTEGGIKCVGAGECFNQTTTEEEEVAVDASA